MSKVDGRVLSRVKVAQSGRVILYAFFPKEITAGELVQSLSRLLPKEPRRKR